VISIGYNVMKLDK